MDERGRIYKAIVDIMEGLSDNWDMHEQVNNGADPIGFSVDECGDFFFGEIGRFKVACWTKMPAIAHKIKEVLQHFTNAKCVLSIGVAAAFDSALKRGDIIVSDCIDGVKTVEPGKSKTNKCLFHPEETRFTPVSRDLTSIFDSDWNGIMCTQQRQRKSKVLVGTVMAMHYHNFIRYFDVLDLSCNPKTYLGIVPGGLCLLEAVNECSEQDTTDCNKLHNNIITIHGVIGYPTEIGTYRFKWLPTAANSVAQYLKFKLENTPKSHPLFSG